ncbi:MAG TPA: hypothetical protein VKB80_20430 [Kofleriaceae bacterium]|nr:hypothetical protein [Kofleriaceae bacterium]
MDESIPAVRAAIVPTLLVVALAAAPAGPAAAQEPAVRLDLAWEAPSAAGCPAAAALRAWIDDAAGAPALGRAEVRASRRGERWLARVRVAGTDRQLVGATCREVAAAAAVIVGLALREPREGAARRGPPRQVRDREVPRELERGRPPDRPVAPEPVASAASEPDIDASSRAPRSPGGAARLDVGARFGADVGVLGGVAPAARAGLRVAGARLAAGVEGAYATAAHPVSMPAGMASARMTLVSVAAGGCLAALSGVWMCVGAEVGRLSAEATSPFDAASGSGLWLAAHAGPSAAWPVSGGLELVVDAEAVVPVAYPRFVVNREAPLPRPSPVGLRSGVGLRLRFP